MARRDLELKILNLRFRHYTEDVRHCISRIVSSQHCHHASDIVIDGLWKSCPDQIAALLDRSCIDQRHSVQGDATLAPEAREIIRIYIDQARSYREEIINLEDDDFEALYRTTLGPIEKARRERRAQSSHEWDRWAFFNEVNADADFERWRDRMLTPAQATALLLGKDPDVVTPESLKPYRRVAGSPFREAFKDRLDLIEAAVATGKLSMPMSVSDFAQWATAHGLKPPPELTGEAVEVIGDDAAIWKQKYEAAQSELEKLRRGIDDLPPKSRASIYRLIVGMAAARFEYRTDQRTKATEAIRDGLVGVGLPLGKDAILDHLTTAALALDYSWTKPILWAAAKKPEG